MMENDTDEPLECVRQYSVDTGQNKTVYFYGGFSGIPENLVLNIIVYLIMFAIFLVARWFRIYKEKRDVQDGEVNTFWMFEHVQDVVGWIPELFLATDDQISERCGWDAVIYLRFQRYLMLLTLGACILSCCVVLPINHMDDIVSDFGKTTIANVDGDSDVIWLHVAMAAVYLLVIIVAMKVFTRRYVKARAPKTINKTLLISHVPTKTVTHQELYQYFREQIPEVKIETINYAYDVKDVSAIQDQRKYVRLTRSEAEEMNARTGEQDMSKPYPCACFCCCCQACKKVETVCMCDKLEEEHSMEYMKHVKKALQNPLDIVFLTFYTENMAIRVYNHFNKVWRLRCVCRARCCPQSSLDDANWIVYYSPRPDDIYWHNLAAIDLWWWVKAGFLNFCLLFFLFIFTTPAVFMNLLDEWRYKDALAGLRSPLIVNVIPVLLLSVFSCLLPLLVYFSELLIGHWRRTIEEKLIMQKTYSLLLIMALILPSLGLTSAKALLMWLADQKGAMRHFRWNCVFLPDNGAFFVNYVITASFMGNGLQLLRVGDLLVFTIKLFCAKSAAERQLIRKSEGVPFPYGQQYAWVGVVYGMVMSYSIICPIIVPFGLMYLVMKHLVDRHNIYFVSKKVRLGGEVHVRAVNFVLAGGILLQVWMIIFTAIRSDDLPPTSAFALAVLLLALFYLTGNAVYKWIKHQLQRMKLVFTCDASEMENMQTTEASFGLESKKYVPEVIRAGKVEPSSYISHYPFGSRA